MRQLISDAANLNQAVTLGVVKINPALRLYQRLGFKITHEDVHKFRYPSAPCGIREQSRGRSAPNIPISSPAAGRVRNGCRASRCGRCEP